MATGPPWRRRSPETFRCSIRAGPPRASTSSSFLARHALDHLASSPRSGPRRSAYRRRTGGSPRKPATDARSRCCSKRLFTFTVMLLHACRSWSPPRTRTSRRASPVDTAETDSAAAERASDMSRPARDGVKRGRGEILCVDLYFLGAHERNSRTRRRRAHTPHRTRKHVSSWRPPRR